VRGAEIPGTRPVGPGERAFSVAEELGLGQRLGEGGAVDGEERARATAPLMNRMRRPLLSRARLSVDHDGQIAARRALDGGERLSEPPSAVETGNNGPEVVASRLLDRRRDDDADPLSESDHVTALEGRMLDLNATNEDAIAAAEVPDREKRPFAKNLGVRPRDFGARERNGGVRVASEHERGVSRDAYNGEHRLGRDPLDREIFGAQRRLVSLRARDRCLSRRRPHFTRLAGKLHVALASRDSRGPASPSRRADQPSVSHSFASARVRTLASTFKR